MAGALGQGQKSEKNQEADDKNVNIVWPYADCEIIDYIFKVYPTTSWWNKNWYWSK